MTTTATPPTTTASPPTATASPQPHPAPAVLATPPLANPAGPGSHDRSDRSIWTVARVIALALTVLETLLLARFGLLLFGANATQPLVAFVYGITAPLVRPFQGIFGQPEGPPTFEVAALLALVFFLLMGALVIAAVRALTGRRTGPRSSS